MSKKTKILVRTKINVPLEMVWEFWITPKDIVNWNNASDDWHTTKAENDLQIGGNFNYTMEAKDGSFGFDFAGVYDKVNINKQIDFTLGDKRKVKVVFSSHNNKTEVVETFEAEKTNSVELQSAGWQAILDNFKKYAEEHYNNQTK